MVNYVLTPTLMQLNCSTHIKSHWFKFKSLQNIKDMFYFG